MEVAPAQEVGGVVDLPLPGQEHERVADAGQLVAGVADRLDLVAAVDGALHLLAVRAVADLDRVRPPGHLDDGRVDAVAGEVAGEAGRVDRRRRDDHLEVRPARQQLAEVAEDEVDVEAALVGLVDDQRVVAAQVAIAVQLGEQDPVGHHPHERPVAHPVVEAHRVADVTADASTRARRRPARRSFAPRTRRGWVWPIRPATPRPSSRHILGSCVLLPDPVSPATTTTWWSRIVASRSSRRAVIGRASGYVSRPARASASRRARRRSSPVPRAATSVPRGHQDAAASTAPAAEITAAP